MSLSKVSRQQKKPAAERFQIFALLILICSAAVPAQSQRQEPYSWKNVKISGAGFVDGVVFHPTAPNVRYARTDMGGAYRWDAVADRWQPILDWVSHKDVNLMGVESIALDPSDANRVYLACGTYTQGDAPNGAILRSDDRGRTFARTDLPFKLGGNEDGRGNGERLAVDPRDGRVLYLGTRHDGLWRSGDRGVTWSRVDSFPDISEAEVAATEPPESETPAKYWRRKQARGDGIVFVKFGAPAEQAGSQSLTIYVGVSLMGRPNFFDSTDGGASWRAIPGEPTAYRPTRAALSRDGFLYVAYGSAPGPSRMTNGGLWKLDLRGGAWTDITPEHPSPGGREFGYAAVAVDSLHPRWLIASTFGRPGGDDIFRSIDGGASWKAIFTGGDGVFDYQSAPYTKVTPIHWLFDIEIDPANSNHAVFTTGYGGWETFDLTAADKGLPTHWRILARGIEESVALDLVSPTDGAHLVSAIGDYGGFVHWNLDAAPPAGSSAPPRMSNTTGVAAATERPEILVRVGVSAARKAGDGLGYSLDGGRTWQPSATAPTPNSHAGSIAVGADGDTWIWTPEHEAASVTRDRGATWTPVQGLPPGLRVLADPLSPRAFYAVALSAGLLYRSSDGGATFTSETFELPGDPATPEKPSRGDTRGGQDKIYAAPGRSGDLWLAAFDGLYHLASPAPGGGISFVRMPGVEEIEAFGFGKAAPHRSYPAIYLAGTVNGESGVFRSLDQAKSWTRINDDRHQWGLILQISGDPRVYGRVYVGTHGRGILYGDPVER